MYIEHVPPPGRNFPGFCLVSIVGFDARIGWTGIIKGGRRVYREGEERIYYD